MSVVSTKAKTVEAVVKAAPRELLPLLRAYAGTYGVITSRCYTENQPVVFAEIRKAFPDAALNVNHDLKTVALTFPVQGVSLRFVFELREVSDLIEGSVSE